MKIGLPEKLILILSFKDSKKIKYIYSNVNFLELIKMIAELNLIMQNHVRRIHDHETDVRRIWDLVVHSAFFFLFCSSFLSKTAFNIQCFGVLKFQSTSQVLLLSSSAVFCFVLVSMELLIYF